jgi:hypothetical protein
MGQCASSSTLPGTRSRSLSPDIGTATRVSLSLRGANPIIAMRYDATDVMTGLTEVLCYGTAVVAEPVRM